MVKMICYGFETVHSAFQCFCYHRRCREEVMSALCKRNLFKNKLNFVIILSLEFLFSEIKNSIIQKKMGPEKDGFLYTKVNVKRVLSDNSGAETLTERALVFETTYMKGNQMVPVFVTKVDTHIDDFKSVMLPFKLTMVSEKKDCFFNCLLQ